jgi:hypothetical protein
VSPEASLLIAAAEAAGAACDLQSGPPLDGAAKRRALVELLAEADLGGASPRALWNLLWLAAELTAEVDVYRAAELWSAVERLFARRFAGLSGCGELSQVAEMTFDFFFNHRAHPLEALRLGDLLAALGRILSLDGRACRRAALHGLGHLRQRHAETPARDRIEAIIDAFLASSPDPALAAYALEARAGTVL